MISLIHKYLLTSHRPDAVLDQNQLFKAIYGQFNVNNLVVWMDNKVETFINEGYRGNAMVYSIIRKIQDKDAEVPLLAFKNNGKEKRYKGLKYKVSDLDRAQSKLERVKSLDEVNKGDLMELLKQPNPTQTQTEFIKECSMWFRLTGEAFIYGVRVGGGLRDAKKFTELYCLPVNLVDIIQGDMFMPFKGVKFNIGNQTVEIPASELCHIKMANPLWDLQGTQMRGQSPLLAGIKFLSKNNEAVSSLKRSLENEGAKGFISPDASQDPEKWITAEQLPGLRQQLQKYWDGSMNKNRVGALAIPMQYQSIALSPVALDILKGMEYDDEKLCNLWGVNPALFRSDSKYDNLNEAKKQLVMDVCLPFLKQLEQALTDFLLPAFPGEADYLDFDISEYSELNADSKIVMETFWKGGLATLNECRIMLGFDEIDEDWARAIYTEANKITLEEAFNGGGGADFQDLVR